VGGAPGVGEGNFFTSIHDAMLREVANMLRTVYPRVLWFSPLRECDLRKLRQKLRYKFALPFL
jgi:hypothetical protein